MSLRCPTLHTPNEVRFLLMNARHLRISFWASMQYAVDLPPDCRCQISYLVCTNENQHQYKKKLWNMFFGCVEKYALFDTTFSQITRVGRAATFSQITRDWRSRCSTRLTRRPS